MGGVAVLWWRWVVAVEVEVAVGGGSGVVTNNNAIYQPYYFHSIFIRYISTTSPS